MRRYKLLLDHFLYSPFAFQCVSFSLLFLFIFGFQPLHEEDGWYFSLSDITREEFLPLSDFGFIKNDIGVDTSGLTEVFIEDEEGNRVRQIVSQKRNEKLSYKVKSGDNISKIAHKFGLKVSTILWANRITSKNTLDVGKTLVIPPVDGIYYTVKDGDTLGEVAKIHGIDFAKIKAYNRVKNNVIKAGQEVFLPEAKKLYIADAPPVKNTIITGRINTGVTTVVNTGSLSFIRPTQGVLTQGFKSGHYALDIASALNTPIYASAGGVVTKAHTSGWNYGYGRYIVIDHGNGVETLYGHNNILKVSVGDSVKKGQLIALMGNTGRVFGRTGIHLHFEIRVNGRKVNPYNYFR